MMSGINVVDAIDAINAVVDTNAIGIIHHDNDDVLSLSLVHEIFEYIHIDFKNIIHREGNTFFDNQRNRLPLSLIMNSGLEEYFERVLLSNRLKDRLCNECAKRGQLDSLKWARSKGCPWSESRYYSIGTIDIAARAGHLHIVKWARENGCDWSTRTCRSAAEGGHLDILKWLRENGCDWNSNAYFGAARGGHLDILQWLLENGWEWDEDEAYDFGYELAGAGRLDILKWAKANFDIYIYFDVCREALEKGYLHIVKWAITAGCEMESDFEDEQCICTLAADMRLWDIVHLAIDHGCSYPPSVEYQLCSMKHQKQLASIQTQLASIQQQLTNSDHQQQLSDINQKLSDMQEDLLDIEDLSSLSGPDE